MVIIRYFLIILHRHIGGALNNNWLLLRMKDCLMHFSCRPVNGESDAEAYVKIDKCSLLSSVCNAAHGVCILYLLPFFSPHRSKPLQRWKRIPALLNILPHLYSFIVIVFLSHALQGCPVWVSVKRDSFFFWVTQGSVLSIKRGRVVSSTPIPKMCSSCCPGNHRHCFPSPSSTRNGEIHRLRVRRLQLPGLRYWQSLQWICR